METRYSGRGGGIPNTIERIMCVDTHVEEKWRVGIGNSSTWNTNNWHEYFQEWTLLHAL